MPYENPFQASSGPNPPAGRHRAPLSGERMVLLTHEFHPFHGGVSTYCQELARALHQEGQPVEVWAPTYSGAAHDDGAFPFPVRRLPVAGRLTPWDIGRLTLYLSRHSRELADATLVVASYGTFLAMMAADFFNVKPGGKVVCIWYGSEMLKVGASPIWFRLARRFVEQPRVSVATVSRYTRDLAGCCLGQAIRNKAIHLLPCAPGTAACRESPAPSADSAGRVNLLTVARLHPRKGQLDVARALAMLPAELKRKVIYRIAGSGDRKYLGLVAETCRQAGISLVDLGLVTAQDLPGLYASCDLFIMASRSLERSVEGLGIVYLEAAWHGKPSVGYRTGGAGEAVRDGQTGRLVTEGDVSALAGAIEELVVDEGLRRLYGDNARQLARTFRWEKAARELIEMAREDGPAPAGRVQQQVGGSCGFCFGSE